MENITNIARDAETEYEREEDLADEVTTDTPDVPDGTFGELPPDPVSTGREPAAATEREAEALLPPE